MKGQGLRGVHFPPLQRLEEGLWARQLEGCRSVGLVACHTCAC
jgi:hypothetical protein